MRLFDELMTYPIDETDNEKPKKTIKNVDVAPSLLINQVPNPKQNSIQNEREMMIYV